MNFKLSVSGVLGGIVLTVATFMAYKLGLQHGMTLAVEAGEPVEDPAQWSPLQQEEATRRHMDAGIRAGDVDPLTDMTVSYYYDPMLPDRHFDAPGKSPFMDMMMVPAYEADAALGDTGTVVLSARISQNSGIRTAVVAEGSLTPRVRAVGTIAWNEREAVVLQARQTGFVEALHVRAEFDSVVAGQPLVELYVPDWVALQEEYLVLSRMQGMELEPLLDAARMRMRQAGMDDEQIQKVIESGEVHPRVTLSAPFAGVVSELGVREGMTVMPGMTLFRLNGTATVWAEAEVPESQAALLQEGAQTTARTPSVPGKVFAGTLQSLLPQLDLVLRTRKARIELANPDGLLVPGMFLQMELDGNKLDDALLIPSEALIVTGNRSVVMLAGDEGAYYPVEVTSGTEYEGQTVIVSGLSAGQRVVTSGQFLLDSEASLRGLEARLQQEPAALMEQQP